jgi:hypothetical protein
MNKYGSSSFLGFLSRPGTAKPGAKSGKVQDDSSLCKPGVFNRSYLEHLAKRDPKENVPDDIKKILDYYKSSKGDDTLDYYNNIKIDKLVDNKLKYLDNIIGNEFNRNDAFDLEFFIRDLKNPVQRHSSITDDEKDKIQTKYKEFNREMNNILTDIINDYDDPIEIISKSMTQLNKICATELVTVLFNIKRKLEERQKLKIQSAGAKKRSAKKSIKKRSAKKSAKKSSKKRSAKKSIKKRSAKKSAKKSSKKRSAKKSTKKRSANKSAKKSTKKRSAKKSIKKRSAKKRSAKKSYKKRSAKKSIKKRSAKKSAKKSSKKRSAKKLIAVKSQQKKRSAKKSMAEKW